MAQLKLLVFIILIAFLNGCCAPSRIHEIPDVTRGDTIILRKTPDQGHIQGVSIRGRGYIEGTAEISWVSNGNPYKTEVLSGNVSFLWGGDWYSDEVEIKYLPASATAGRLQLKYSFGDSMF